VCGGKYKWFIQEQAEARASFIEAQKVYSKLNKPLEVATCNCWISRIFHGEGQNDEARMTAEAAFAEYERLDHRDSAAETLVHLCTILTEIKCYDEAMTYRKIWNCAVSMEFTKHSDANPS
jgi:hypothetical protein